MNKIHLSLALALALALATSGSALAGISVGNACGGCCEPPQPWYTYWPITAYCPPRSQPVFPFWPTPQQQVGMFPGWPSTGQRHEHVEPRPLFLPEVQRAVGQEPAYWQGR